MLSLWLARFPDASPDACVFPKHRVAGRGGKADHHVYAVDLSKPIGSWKRAWRYACIEAGLPYRLRWHDWRVYFITRLAERPEVSEQTIMALAGHVSKQMLAHYSQIRNLAKNAAIAVLDESNEVEADVAGSAQKPAQITPEQLN